MSDMSTVEAWSIGGSNLGETAFSDLANGTHPPSEWLYHRGVHEGRRLLGAVGTVKGPYYARECFARLPQIDE